MKNRKRESQTRQLKRDIKVLQNEQEDKDTMIHDLSDKVKRYTNLIKFSELISSLVMAKRADKEIYRRGIGKLRELLECEVVRFYQVDKATNEVFYEYKAHINLGSGHTKEQKKRVAFKIDEHSLPGACAFYMAILHVADVSLDSRFKRHENEEEGSSITYKDMLVAPLVVEGELLGVIQAVNSHRGVFNKEDVLFMQAVSNQMSLILQYIYAVNKAKLQLYQVSQSFAYAINIKDKYTGGHTRRVAHFAEVIGKEFGLSQDEMEDLRLAGVLHDIGKIGIEDSILKKQSQLTKEEFEKMKKHPHLGYTILGNVDGFKRVVNAIRFHHERPDGKGYPYGISGDEISVLAQIISVADTFDAIISDRPYRKGLAPMRAYHEIVQFKGKQFKKEVVDAFERAFKKSHMYKPELDTGEAVSKVSKDGVVIEGSTAALYPLKSNIDELEKPVLKDSDHDSTTEKHRVVPLNRPKHQNSPMGFNDEKEDDHQKEVKKRINQK